MKKRIISTILAVAMAFTLMPTMALPVNAGATGAKAIMLGTGGIIAGDHIYYGNNGSDINWRVLSKTGNGGTYKDSLNQPYTGDAIFLLSEYVFDVSNVPFDNSAPYSSEWSGSNARAWCTSKHYKFHHKRIIRNTFNLKNRNRCRILQHHVG